jgi:hypothetical protein
LSGATISGDGKYRYRLWRNLQASIENGSKGTVAFVMLNPSTADSTQDDPTIRRCIKFAKDWGYTRLEVVNLSPIRATSPEELIMERGEGWQMPCDVTNHWKVEEVIEQADLVVAAWGANVERCDLETRADDVIDFCDELHVLGLTKNGHPRHPLYMPKDAKPTRWER